MKDGILSKLITEMKAGENRMVTENRKTFLGIDGGGTKTEFVLFYNNGEIIDRLVLEGCNPNTCGAEKTYSILKEGIERLSQNIEKIDVLFAGIAGCGSLENAETVYGFLTEICPDTKVKCCSDILNIVASANVEKRALAVICGTGSVVYSINEDNLERAGGWGYLLGDPCSGYSIGRDAIRVALAEEDGFGEKSFITCLVEEELGGSVKDKINQVYSKHNTYLAKFAPIVFKAYEKKDKQAKDILEKNAKEFAKQINFMSRKYDCDNTAVLSGGIFQHSNIYEEFLKSLVDENIKVVIPNLPPIYGACVQCIRMAGEYNEDFQKMFTEEYNKKYGK